MMRRIVIPKDQLIVTVLIVIGVLSFAKNKTLYFQNFDKFKQRAIPEPDAPFNNALNIRDCLIDNQTLNDDFLSRGKNIKYQIQMSAKSHLV